MRIRRWSLSVAAAAALSVSFVGPALALDGGAMNGQDVPAHNGVDNPDGVTGSYAFNNVTQLTYLKEWLESHHDGFREANMSWSVAAENKLDDECDNRFLTFEKRILDQFYYDLHGSGNYTTNLPLTQGPESENGVEEANQGYSEFDAESKNCQNINQGTFYWLEFEIDSEKTPTSSRPVFYSELEWCDDLNPFVCNFDVTGRFEKEVLQR